ncbi:MAG: hypothetical protein K6T35_11300, partial [Meiothermus silvanus]|nr:hypothetical protein [Allomeiothermus silvanus]
TPLREVGDLRVAILGAGAIGACLAAGRGGAGGGVGFVVGMFAGMLGKFLIHVAMGILVLRAIF